MLPRALLAIGILTLTFALTDTAAAQSTAQVRLWDASIAGDTTAIAAALDDGAHVDSLDTRRSPNGRRALNWAALNGHVPALRVLLARGATLEARNRTGFSALHHAAEAGSGDAARFLLSAGADPRATNRAGMTPGVIARDQGHVGIALLLQGTTDN